MMSSVRVNLHCHSNRSDGTLPPEAVAQRLADAGVVCAALTDHNTVAGLDRFRETLRQRGVGVIDGIELTCHHDGEEVHLLGLGIDPHNPALLATTAAMRGHRPIQVASVARALPEPAAGTPVAAVESTALDPDGRLAVADGIALIHHAGGLAFLAHPSVLRLDPERLRPLLGELQRLGLDGMEAFYGPNSADLRARLVAVARESGLLPCAGTDWHGEEDGGPGGVAIDIPSDAWMRLRTTLRPAADALPPPESHTPERHRRHRRHFALHIVLPALLAIGLFVEAFYALFLPSFERSLLDRKREMISELTHAAWSILADAEAQATAGRMTRAEAQAMARDRVSAMRYGHENKDYFWLQDMHPRMVAHPYRPELEGHDLTDYRDPRGIRIFVEFADLVRRHGEGYVDYIWQWPDDPRRMEPKESYVKGFPPWGWIIGTGLYLEDVQQEIARIERGVVRASTAIALLVVVLLVNIVRYSRRIERRRADAEAEMREANERYRTLVEASATGTLLLRDGRVRHANTRILDLLGYKRQDLDLLALPDLLPPTPANTLVHERIELAQRAGESTTGVTAELHHRDGHPIPCLLSLIPASDDGRSGLALHVQDAAATERNRPGTGEAPTPGPTAAMAEDAPVGLFRTRVGGRGTVIEANRIARRFLPGFSNDGTAGKDLSDLFHDPRDYDALVARLLADGTAQARTTLTGPDGRILTLGLRASVVRDAAREPLFIDGVLEDVTSLARRDAERDAMIQRLQAALLPFRGRETLIPTAEIAAAASFDEVAEACRRTPAALQALLATDAPARTVARLATTVCDAATERFVALAIEELGPSPAPFAFLALGSQARQEQTFAADQDNALVYAPHGPNTPAMEAYFLELGRRVCAGLAHAGYPQCRGHVMAKFAVWSRTLKAWKVHFKYWIETAEPQELLQFAICFDFRAVAGEASLAQELRQYVFEALRDTPQSLPHFARHALLFRPPLVVFGRVLLGRAPGLAPGMLDIKDAIVPLIAFARLYALRYALVPVNTLDRLDALVQAGHLQPASRDELAAAFDLLLRLRLRQQARALQAGEAPDNRIRLRRLTRPERFQLRQAFAWIKAVQHRIGYEFLGGTGS